MNSLNIVIGEICLFLDARTTFLIVSLVCKEFFFTINTNEYKLYWIKNVLGIDFNISMEQARMIYEATHKNMILNYCPWKTDGGVSPRETFNRFENMWEYNGSNYSTYYDDCSDFPIRANVNCLACFNGGLKQKDFFNSFYMDCYQYFYQRDTIPEKYDLRHYNQKKTLILDPLGQDLETLDTLDNMNFSRYFRLNSSKVFDHYVLPMKTSEEIPFVTKIAVARPFFFTGAVKTLVVIACEDYVDVDFEYFRQYNDINCVEAAETVGKVIKKKVDDEDVIYIEYARGKGFYPLMWMQFRSCRTNHVEIKLTKAHYPRIVCVKMIDIDDRREDYNMQVQPNYDITYTLFIGGTVGPTINSPYSLNGHSTSASLDFFNTHTIHNKKL
jgi:hypothetical protein